MTGSDEAAFVDNLRRGAGWAGCELSDPQVAQCVRYTELMLAFNEHTNLTRITDPAEVAWKHFADSFTVLSALPTLASSCRLADVGTGAGFPGLALKIAAPNLRVTLIDSLGKRILFWRASLKRSTWVTSHSFMLGLRILVAIPRIASGSTS